MDETQRQYSPSCWSQRMGPQEVIMVHVSKSLEGSVLARETLPCQIGLCYGDTPEQRLDVYGMDILKEGAPILVYLHGGYWQALSAAESGFMAPSLVPAGVVVVALGYDLAPKVSVEEIMSQVKRGLSKVLELALSNKSKGVYLCGHSAGGHLAAMLLAENWTRPGDSRNNNVLKGAMLVSGVFDLRPLVKTTENEALKMTEQSAWQLSPQNEQNLDRIQAHSHESDIIIAYGQYDSPEFQRQSMEFHQSLKQRGLTSLVVKVDNRDHFDVIDQLADKDYELTHLLCNMMHVG